MTQHPAAHRNRLALETSPYLLQHASNPVDWYPWGQEALEKARTEDRPVLLSVGYSSCHWCHVMAHESFEDPQTAALMNRYFINIKVDREERPDIDSVYMTAVQAMTGQGGWPMTVFMTPDGKPFYAGTYFPPADGYGRPSFRRVLEALNDKWQTGRAQLAESAERVAGHLQRAVEQPSAGPTLAASDLSAQAVDTFRHSFDRTWGGFGTAPKFPSPANLEFLLAYHSRVEHGRSDAPALEMVTLTLRRMATGGMYDQLGGGFARYSVDQRWLVPHFEKMLYDNAQLVRVYLHAWQITGEPLYELVARETLAYLEREMLDDEGGFYAAEDADSEGIEGKYFLWTADEVDRLMGGDAPLFKAWFGVTPEGNFHDPHHPELTGRNVLTAWQDPAEIAGQFGLAPEALLLKVDELRARALDARARRVPPGLDDKVLTSWNGLALAAFAEAARILGDGRYRTRAERNAAFVRSTLWRDGRLLHSYRAGRASVAGMLEDYAYYGLGLVELYKLTGDLHHLDWARSLFEVLLQEFRDAGSAGFFETGQHGEQLLLRPKPLLDSATPSGNGAAALLGTWLARYYGKPEWGAGASEVVRSVGDHLVQAATGFGSILQVLEFSMAPPREVVIVGDAIDRGPLEREAARHYLPWAVIAPSAGATGLPLFEDRAVHQGAVAYVCENMVCRLPVSTPQDLAEQLRQT